MRRKSKVDGDIKPPAEFEKARGRIGVTGDKSTRWLLRFADLSLDGLSEGDLLNLQYEVKEFGRALGGLDQKFIIMHDPDSPAISSLTRLPAVEQLRAHQHFVEQILDGIIQGQWYEFHIPSMKVFLTREDRQAGILAMLLNDYQAPFNLAVALALQPLTHRIRRCPECDKRFLADRTNQDYDSPVCQSRAGMRRYRQAKGLVTGRRRGRPPKQGKTDKVGQKHKSG